MIKQKKLISIVSPCYNEEDNIEELYRRVSDVLLKYSQYDFEFLFIDNASTDSTVQKMKAIAANDRRSRLLLITGILTYPLPILGRYPKHG